jgi:hypothetical protein
MDPVGSVTFVDSIPVVEVVFLSRATSGSCCQHAPPRTFPCLDIRLTRVALIVRLVDSTLASLAGDRLLAGGLIGLGSCVLVAVDKVRRCRCHGGRKVADGLHSDVCVGCSL